MSLKKQTKNQFTIELKDWSTKEVTISITDINGKSIETKSIRNISKSESINFNTQKWSRGVYLIKVTDGEKSIYKKLILN